MNKEWDQLWKADQIIRRLCPVDMSDRVKLTIQLFNGFEKFNTRPYHNYETWSDGYRITDGTITVEAEDLDDALRAFIEKRREQRAPIPCKCGAKPVIDRGTGLDLMTQDNRPNVGCPNCHEGVYADTVKKAIEAWNRGERTPPMDRTTEPMPERFEKEIE